MPESDYKPRTIKLCVTAIRNINGISPSRKVIFKDFQTIDLSLPAPNWKDTSFDSFEGRQTKIRFSISMQEENEAFYPQESKDFLRFDVALWGQIREEEERTAAASTWVDPNASYAASKVIMGPLADGPIHFVFATIFQKTQN